jgi:hypothetical protein
MDLMFDLFKHLPILDDLVINKFICYLKTFFFFILARPTGGAPQPMSRNSDTYINRNQNRNQSSNIKRTLPANNNNNDQHHQYGNNNRDRHGPMNNGSNNDRHRSSSAQRSRSRTNKMVTPKRNSRAPTPKYTCTLPKASLDR